MGAKAVCLAAVMLLVLGCFTTACIPRTRDAAIPVETTGPVDPVTPETWQDTLEWMTGATTRRIVIDAEPVEPDAYTPALYRVTPLSRDAFTKQMLVVMGRLADTSALLTEDGAAPASLALTQDANEPDWYLFQAYQPDAQNSGNDICLDGMYREGGMDASVSMRLRDATAGGVLLKNREPGDVQQNALAACETLALGQFCVQDMAQSVSEGSISAPRSVTRLNLRPVYGGLYTIGGCNDVYLGYAREGLTSLSVDSVRDVALYQTDVSLRPFSEVQEAFLRQAPQEIVFSQSYVPDGADITWRIDGVRLQLARCQAADGDYLVPAWALYGVMELRTEPALAPYEVTEPGYLAAVYAVDDALLPQ